VETAGRREIPLEPLAQYECQYSSFYKTHAGLTIIHTKNPVLIFMKIQQMVLALTLSHGPTDGVTVVVFT
jgi:hypothetical protein